MTSLSQIKCLRPRRLTNLHMVTQLLSDLDLDAQLYLTPELTMLLITLYWLSTQHRFKPRCSVCWRIGAEVLFTKKLGHSSKTDIWKHLLYDCIHTYSEIWIWVWTGREDHHKAKRMELNLFSSLWVYYVSIIILKIF